jgi:hypothetical protein
MRILLPTLPPSLNHAYIGQGRWRRLSPEARTWKEENQQVLTTPKEWIGKPLAVTITISSRTWHNKNGSIKKKDLANYEKLTIDLIFSALEVDDSAIWDLRMVKVVGDEGVTVDLGLA